MNSAQNIIADTVQNGGGTYDAITYEPYDPADGFAVAIGGARIPADRVTPRLVSKAIALLRQEFGTELVGTWLDGDIVYIDAVRHIYDVGEAKALGREHHQLSIYNFATEEVVWLVSEEAR